MENWGWWPFLVWLLWMAFCVWGWNKRAHAEKDQIDESWSELARRTGLDYSPGGLSLGGIASAFKKPSVTGVYRGRQISLAVVSETVNVYDGFVSLAYTKLTLPVNNRAHCSFTVQEKKVLTSVFRGRDVGGGDEDIDPRFSIKCQPQEIIPGTARLVKQLVQQRPTIQRNRSPFFWTSATKFPSLRLNGPDLVWQQYDVLTGATELIELMNQLCDLAELVEELGVKAVTERMVIYEQ